MTMFIYFNSLMELSRLLAIATLSSSESELRIFSSNSSLSECDLSPVWLAIWLNLIFYLKILIISTITRMSLQTMFNICPVRRVPVYSQSTTLKFRV